jgi:hypothetical protein
MSVRQPRIKQRAPSSLSPSRMASDTRAHQPTPVHNSDVPFERVPRFGHDFSQVRVHTDARAATVAQSLDALAFTVGDDIAFAPGQYRPGSDEGRALLAHELTHTLQQTGGVARVQRQENVNTGSPSTGNGSSPGSGRRMISYGSQGKDVVDAQQLLNQHGAAPPLVIDGIFGPKTRQATIEFQKTHGLVPDGIIGPLTWGALESGAPGPQPPGPQPPGPQPTPVERWTNEDRAMIAAHIQPGVLTAYQASRIEPAVMALADARIHQFSRPAPECRFRYGTRLSVQGAGGRAFIERHCRIC